MVSFSAGQEAARRLLEGSQRYTCLAGGTRSGKTFLIVRMIMMRALEAKDSRHVILRHHANAARASIALGTRFHVGGEPTCKWSDRYSGGHPCERVQQGGSLLCRGRRGEHFPTRGNVWRRIDRRDWVFICGHGDSRL